MSPRRPERKALIGELLVQARLIEPAHLEEALAEQRVKGGRIVEVLIDRGYIDIPAFVKFLAEEAGTPGIDILNYEIGADTIRLVPGDFARRHEVFPLDRIGNLLTIGMVCPLDSKAIQELERLTNLRVRAFLCHKDDLLAMINRHYRVHEEIEVEREQELEGEPEVPREQEAPRVEMEGLEPSIRARYLANMIRRIDSLPSLPATAQRCQEAMSNPEISARDLAQIIEMDPAVAANLLHVVNSAAFALPNRVSDLAVAITLLGIREACMIVLGATISKLLKVPKWFDHVGFRRAALFCAALSKAIGPQRSRRNTACYFTAGLLHDLGRQVLAIVTPYRYARMPKHLNDHELTKLEEETLGMSHSEAGYVLASNWSLPPELIEPIRFHCNPEAAPNAREIVEVVGLAVDLCDANSQAGQGIEAFAEANAGRLAALGLSKESLLKMIKGADATVDESIALIEGANGFMAG